MSVTLNEAEKLLQFYFDNVDRTAPTDLYVGLHDGNPGEDALNNEIAFGGYDRQQTDPTDWSFDGQERVENNIEIIFGPATEDWGDITHYSLWDSSVDGEAWFVSDLENIRQILEDDRARFAPGNLDFQVVR